jgi:hypothetical protein
MPLRLTDRSLVLAQHFRPAFRGDLAGLQIDQEFHLPGLKDRSGHTAAEQLANQAVESIEHEFLLHKFVSRVHK